MPYLDITMILFMPHPGIVLSYSGMSVPTLSNRKLNVVCVLDRYEKKFTVAEFATKYNEVLTTIQSYICFKR